MVVTKKRTSDSPIVTVQFDQIHPDEWSDNVLMEFRNVLTNLTGKYCFENITACGMRNYRYSYIIWLMFFIF